MKRITLLLSLIALVSSSYAVSIVNGTWNRRGNAQKVSLYSINKGVLKEEATATVNAKREFIFAFNPDKEDFYVIGESRNSNHNGPINRYTFYLKPDDNLNVAVNDTSYMLVGENTLENIEMQRWHDQVQPLEFIGIYFMGKNTSYVDFFPLLEDKLPQIEAYQSKATNELFNKAFADYRKFDLLNDALFLLSTPRSAHPQGEDMPDYYKETVKLEEITATDAILSYPYGMGLIGMAQTYFVTRGSIGEKKHYPDPITRLRDILPLIVDKNVKSEVVLSQFSYFKSYEGAKEYNNEFGEYIVTEQDKKDVKDLLYTLASNSTGQDAFDFKFKDANNKDVALSDFKGKAVYIDVWATWCGPCRKEFPSLHKLEEEYKNNKDIVFMGISTDATKDHAKWKNFLVKEKMSGVQIFAGDSAKNDLLNPYKIKGIPHFLLIDKNGKVVSPNAPRPSSSEIRALLNATLKK